MDGPDHRGGLYFPLRGHGRRSPQRAELAGDPRTRQLSRRTVSHSTVAGDLRLQPEKSGGDRERLHGGPADHDHSAQGRIAALFPTTPSVQHTGHAGARDRRRAGPDQPELR